MEDSDKKINVPTILKLHGDNIKDVRFSSRLVGSTFQPNAQEILKFLKIVNPKDIILSFVREPDNEFDSNAVAIYVSITGAKNTYKIGYFPKDGAPLISYILSHNSDYGLTVTDIHLSGGDSIEKEHVGLFFDFIIRKLK